MKIKNEELVSSGGGWTPGKLKYKPIFIWPLKPLVFLKWLFHYPNGFIFPWAIIHFAITLLSYLFLLPSFDKFAILSLDWVGIIFVRNFFILFIYSGLWHLHLHINNSQKDKYRYNLKPLGEGNRWFLGSQTRAWAGTTAKQTRLRKRKHWL